MRKLRVISFTLFGLAILVLAVSSLLDAITGQEGTATSIYHSIPFAAMWGVLALTAMTYIMRRQLWRAPATFIIHISFAVILLGALVTHIWGQQGRLHLRENEQSDCYELEDGSIERLPFTVVLQSFEIQFYRGTSLPMDYISKLHFDTGHFIQHSTVSMNNIATCQNYRFCQSSYDSDRRGSILLVSHDPWGIGITYTGYGLLLLGMLLFWLQPQSQFHHIKKPRWIRILIGVLLVLPVVIDFRPLMSHITPVLRSAYFPVHVVAISIAYALLIYILINGIVACYMAWQIKMKRKSIVGKKGLCMQNEEGIQLYNDIKKEAEQSIRQKKLRIQRLKDLSQCMLYPALFLLTAGIFIGAVWANVSWGRYWGWDNKEVWALITMMIYSLVLHQKSIPWFSKPLNFHIYCTVAFLTVLMTYFGVNYFLVGLHSYA